MNYTVKDNLPAIRVGDTLTLEDGSVHELISDDHHGNSCIYCSMKNHDCVRVQSKCGRLIFTLKR